MGASAAKGSETPSDSREEAAALSQSRNLRWLWRRQQRRQLAASGGNDYRINSNDNSVNMQTYQYQLVTAMWRP